ncbi:hypothetical protein CVT26_012881 [Gymnopilus dilepis]|uniref:Uncharacterized protein n=1 Tax=Gymnopilus dilepis TaxID=231916 RepID=A0A409YP01_9AGAR|nr:hypothetical protein CVT26_012881 [Gymnopilus dilepis]
MALFADASTSSRVHLGKSSETWTLEAEDREESIARYASGGHPKTMSGSGSKHIQTWIKQALVRLLFARASYAFQLQYSDAADA